ncbi:MAG: helix-turn-helix domain-containing protein [bacterium]|nr:helix-turn-helix domain-containing protein [bacterium]
MKELGQYLKEIRESNSVGVEEASSDLGISENVINNIEMGNTRAFKDVLELKEIVKDYSKYLGLDPEKVIDEFNDFLFEHTSKISLNDILQAEEIDKKKKEEKVVVSPYTHIRKKYISPKYYTIFGCLLLFICFLSILVFILKAIIIPDEKIVNNELLGIKRGVIYERTQ